MADKRQQDTIVEKRFKIGDLETLKLPGRIDYYLNRKLLIT